MICCDNLIHPFQNDSGVSQRQRIIGDLLSGTAKIDGRTMAGLLDYFSKLSRQVKYYDQEMNVSNWEPFFQKSNPFLLASIINYNKETTQHKIDQYNRLFNKRPGRQSLQLLIHFIYNHTIRKINQWHLDIKGSELPAERIVEKLIKDKLNAPVKKFLCLTNYAVQVYSISKLDISKLLINDAWNLPADELGNLNCFNTTASTKRKRLIALRNEIINLFPGFLSIIDLTGNAAELSMEQSLFPLKEELQEKHSPHLGLMFAFLKLFSHLQGDLNRYTKKHLDFFYQDVLKLTPLPAVPDKTHILFEIQNKLDKYLLKKGLQVKDGKDNKKAEIYFATDDEIVVNKTAVADVRTLFLNNKIIYNTSYLEGSYIAPDARKSDGVKIDFKDDGPLNWPTLGSKFSKYSDPEQKVIKPYPNARIGFILASPVLLLNEGKRTVTITLDCELHNDYCNELKKKKEEFVQKNCCQDTDSNELSDDTCKNDTIEQLSACEIYKKVTDELNKKYYYISKALIQEAVKKGISNDIFLKLRRFLLHPNPPEKMCYCPTEIYDYDTVVSEEEFKNEAGNGFAADQVLMLSEIFKPERVFKISFSGEKEWLEPDEIINSGIIESPKISMTPSDIVCETDQVVAPFTSATYPLTITFKTILNTDKPAVTFYNKETLKEDIMTTLPVVKIELNDHIKLKFPGSSMLQFLSASIMDKQGCCLHSPVNLNGQYISLYHFFRNLKLLKTSKIDVQVCGVKNLIVQNDDNVENVNSPIKAFGPRPRVGASFYIGNKELFSKNWKDVYVNVEWKDKPKDFREHYKHYSYKATIFEDGTQEIVNSSFLTTTSVLDKSIWIQNGTRRLFKPPIAGDQPRTKLPPPVWPQVPVKVEIPAPFCLHGPLADSNDIYDYSNGMFPGLSAYKRRQDLLSPLTPYNIGTQYGFFRFTLGGVSFQHDIFPFVLTRQMMAYAGLLSLDIIQKMVVAANDAKKIIDVMINKINMVNLHIGHIQTDIGQLTGQINNISNDLLLLKADIDNALINLPGNVVAAIGLLQAVINRFNNQISTALTGISNKRTDIQGEINLIVPDLANTPGIFNPNQAGNFGLIRLGAELKTIIEFFVKNLQVDPELKDGLPSEPYLPVIKSLSLDYTATADVYDIDLIHLYPYVGTHKHESLQEQPMLFPTFCDEGTIYIGLKGLVTGSNLNMLFQFAEATANSELEREEVVWHYLDNNQWKNLRKGFEVIDDTTNELTTSGIVKFALPENMTSDNTILPKDLHWIKASISKNSCSVSETIGIHTQAIRVLFTNEKGNDKLRLDAPLPAGSVSKLKEADANIKKVEQPYDSFGGREPEVEKQYYVRVSELLRHKGRAIQKWDYERITLEAFPNIYRTKCINHSFALNALQYKNDFPVAPGYVLLAVIPDLTKLKAGNSFEPKAPLSLLEAIEDYIRKRTSPFVRLRVMNPRYEKIDFCLKVKLYKGRDENYYKEKLKEDLREFLAPWAIGEYSKLSFGQCVNRSDIVRFMEGLDYLDFIIDLKMKHGTDTTAIDLVGNQSQICPNTPRSILIAGEIDVCIGQYACEEWDSKVSCLNVPEKIIDFCKPVVIK